MKRVSKVNKNINIMSSRNKLIAMLTALSMSFGAGVLSVSAQNKSNNDNIISNNIDSNIDVDNAIDSLYQKQMSYLIPTVSKLQDFYENVDTKSIIKNGYPNAYNVTKMNFNYDVSYTGGVNYISNSSDKLQEIIKNNDIINQLKIKPDGNGRDPEMGIIKDNLSKNGMGFRTKTEEDKELINKYTKLLGDRVLIDNNIINLINSIRRNECNDEILLNTLESTYNKQMNYIYDTTIKLKKFYSLEDTNNIIKNGYSNAYNSINKDMNAYPVSYGGKDHSFINKDIANQNMTNTEKINKYVDLIKDNEYIIGSLKIKAKDNGRDPEYGIIVDKNNSNGFRVKTDADKELINKYTELLGTYDYIPYDVINLFTNLIFIVNTNTGKSFK